MSNIYTSHAASLNAVKTSTPQSQPIPGREADMAKNNAGGFVFKLDQWGVLDRFIMIGSEGGNYYVGQKEVTTQSFDTVKACVLADGVRTVNRALEYSLAGRAPKNDPAVTVIALAAVWGDEATKVAAFEALPRIARTGTWLFQFVSILDSLGKWNAAAKRGVAKWYTSKDMDRLAVQLLKYQSRNGWAHRDVLRLAHVKPSSDVQSNLFRYAVKGELEQGSIVPQLLIDFELLKRTDSKADVLRIVESNRDVSWEMLPTQWLKDKDILSALVKHMGLTAVIRKLGILTANGVIAPLSQGSRDVVAKLTDADQLRKQRVHPVTILQAMKQYAAGHGEKGSTVWTPNQQVISALDDAFYAAFGTIEKTSEDYFIGVDISGSMQGSVVNGSPNLKAAEVAAVMAMAIARNQPNHYIAGFNTQMVDLKVSPTLRLDAAMKALQAVSWDCRGGTDCAKAFEYALKNKMSVDKFVCITDNETWAGGQSPSQALAKYRAGMQKAAKSVVIGTSVSAFTIADPKDGGMLDVAGFDSAAPQIIAQL